VCASPGRSFFQLHCKDPIFHHKTGICYPEGIGFFKIKATLGIYVAVMSPLLIALSPWLVLISLPLLYYSLSSAAVASFVIVIGYLWWMRVNRRLFYCSLIVLLALGVSYVIFYDMPGGQFHKRFEIWYITFSKWLQVSPFLGVGLGKFAAFAPQSSEVHADGTRPQRRRYL